jgi:hypothetical protein
MQGSGGRRLFVVALVAACGTIVHTSPQQTAATGCELAIRGTWKPEFTHEANPLLLSFSADGWVNVLSGSGEASVHDFDIASQVQYRIDASSNPVRIEFFTRRGDDVFPPGRTALELIEAGDRVLAMLDRETGEQRRWIRVETHRYFLTLAQRPAASGAEGAAIALWTTLDGRRTELAALGVRERLGLRGERTLAFGRIPASLAGRFATESDKDATMLRIELTDSEYAWTRAVFDAWSERSGISAADDIGESALAFLDETLASLNRCTERIQIPRLAPSGDATRQPWAFIQRLRLLNDSRHVADGSFPFTWQPPPVR